MSASLPAKYHPWQIRLHWLTLLLLIVVYATIELRGLTVRGSWQGKTMTAIHMSAGVAVFLLMVIRLLLRTRHQAPPVTPALKRWQSILSAAVHYGLLLLFLALPVLGVISRYLRAAPWSLYGISMPVTLSPDPALSRQLIHWHELLANAGYWLVGLHALAAIVHHFLMRDDTLLRMMPSRHPRRK